MDSVNVETPMVCCVQENFKVNTESFVNLLKKKKVVLPVKQCLAELASVKHIDERAEAPAAIKLPVSLFDKRLRFHLGFFF